MMIPTKSWLNFSLINLFIVALLGLLMRYKIGFEFPVFDQKYIQYSHYHFAFYGWISHTLMVLMANCLEKANANFRSRRYQPIFILNLLSSYGMLFSFLFLGYGIVSIIFSVGAILSTYYFTFIFLQDIKRNEINPVAAKWFKAALFFNFMSTLGIFALGYMMLAKYLDQNDYLATSYYFLHFQYNGWFFFACMGLFTDFLKVSGPAQIRVYRMFLIACIPAYFLSVLFLEIPLWLYVIVVLSAFLQVFAWFLQSKSLRRNPIIAAQPFILRYVLLFVGVALSIKLLLQLGSTVPAISKLAFGFRPIVMAYLHLVLLAIITLFLLFYIYANRLFPATKRVLASLLIFSIAVFLNEVVLAIQGIAAFSYTLVPFVNEVLFAIAILLLVGIGLLAYFSIGKKNSL